MISLESVEQSIVELESKDTSFATCERLAWLYVVRDHLRGYEIGPENKIALRGTSEFLSAIDGKSPEAVWPIMDELMSTVQALHPKMYDKVLEKLKDS